MDRVVKGTGEETVLTIGGFTDPSAFTVISENLKLFVLLLVSS